MSATSIMRWLDDITFDENVNQLVAMLLSIIAAFLRIISDDNVRAKTCIMMLSRNTLEGALLLGGRLDKLLYKIFV